MGFGSSSLFMKIAFILSIVATIIIILGVALPYWYSYESGSNKWYGGLWRACYEVDTGIATGKHCGDYDNDALKDWFRAVQAFEIIGLLLTVAAMILAIIVVFVKNEKLMKLIFWILCFCACGFIIIGVIIYGAETEDNTIYDEYSGAFAITIIAGIVIFVAGILGVLDWMGKGQ